MTEPVEMAKAPQMSADWKGVAAVIIGAMFIGLAPFGLRFAVDEGMQPVGVAFWRFLLSVPMFLGLFFVLKKPVGRPSMTMILCGVFFGLDIICWHIALTMTSVANATFIVNLGNIVLGVLAWVVLKQRPNLYWALAVMFAAGGAFFLSKGGSLDGGSGRLEGDLMAVMGGCFLAFYFLFASMARRTRSALEVIFWATVAEALVALAVALVLEGTIALPSSKALGISVGIAFLAQFCGQGLLVYGLGKTPPAIAGILVFAQAVTAALISWPLFGESLALMQIFGAGLIMCGIFLSQRK